MIAWQLVIWCTHLKKLFSLNVQFIILSNRSLWATHTHIYTYAVKQKPHPSILLLLPFSVRVNNEYLYIFFQIIEEIESDRERETAGTHTQIYKSSYDLLTYFLSLSLSRFFFIKKNTCSIHSFTILILNLDFHRKIRYKEINWDSYGTTANKKRVSLSIQWFFSYEKNHALYKSSSMMFILFFFITRNCL